MNNFKEGLSRGYDGETLKEILRNFDNLGTVVFDEGRNKLKKFVIFHNGAKKEINVKRFGKKNRISNFVYSFRGGKAQKSFIHAERLLKLGINTPEPIAFFENFRDEKIEEKKSYYISEELEYDLTGRELLWDEKIKSEKRDLIISEKDEILRQFAEFTFKIHEEGVEFKDYSPGNILIKRESEKNYSFYIVDLNRTSFGKTMSFNKRMKNVSRAMNVKYFNHNVIKFATRYSELYGRKYDEVYRRLYMYIKKHDFYVYRKDSTRPFREFFKYKLFRTGRKKKYKNE